MRKAKKVIALVLCAILLVAGSVMGTLAYLTSQAGVKNTFTVGNVSITLHESLIDKETGKKLTGTDAGTTPVGIEDIKAIPGRVIDKDPTVTVLKGSEDCYVRLYMIIRWSEEADELFTPQESQDWFNFESDWQLKAKLIDEDPNYVGTEVYEFWHSTKIEGNKEEDTVLAPIFTKISVPGELTGAKFASLAESSIEIIAQAVQAEGFESEAAAFAAVSAPTGIPQLAPITNS